MKNATAISHGSSRLLESGSDGSGTEASIGRGCLPFIELGSIRLRVAFISSQKPIIADSHIGLIIEGELALAFKASNFSLALRRCF
jgi:hypothetical protein